MNDTEKLARVAALLRPVPDFPKPGILFWDIAPLLRDPDAMKIVTASMSSHWIDQNIDVVAGFDARGFIFGPLLAARMGLPFEQIRKPGKLPGKICSQAYSLEYGEDTIEMIDDGFIAGKRVLLVDDVLATGGTALAGATLIEVLGGVVAGLACITELPDLAGRVKLGKYPVQSLISILNDQPYIDVEHCVDICVRDQKVGDLMLIKRLSAPLGYAMPGGRIEPYEGVLAAGHRELLEETGCIADDIYFFSGTVLTYPNRDPRGVKVSYVFSALADTSQAMGESGKTEIAKFYPNVAIPMDEVVLGHERVLQHV